MDKARELLKAIMRAADLAQELGELPSHDRPIFELTLEKAYGGRLVAALAPNLPPLKPDDRLGVEGVDVLGLKVSQVIEDIDDRDHVWTSFDGGDLVIQYRG